LVNDALNAAKSGRNLLKYDRVPFTCISCLCVFGEGNSNIDLIDSSDMLQVLKITI